MLGHNGLTTQFANAEARADADKLRVEELDELFVFSWVGSYESVLLTERPLVGMLQPRAHDILKFHGLGDWVLLLRDTESTRRST